MPDEFDLLFNQQRRNRFLATQDPHAVPQEEAASSGPQPTGWVRNGTENVLIDQSGLTVVNGALAIQDEDGNAVLTGAGFAGPWDDFIQAGGIYNNTFAKGTLGAMSAGGNQVHYWDAAVNGNALAVSANYTNASAGETGSGRRIDMALSTTSKAAGDYVQVSQMVSIVNQVDSVDRPPVTVTAWGNLTVDTGTTIGQFEIRLTAYASDQATTTGAFAHGYGDWPGIAATGKMAAVASIQPDADTAYILIEVRLTRPATTLTTATVRLFGVRAVYGPWIRTGSFSVDMGGSATSNSGTLGYDAAGNDFANVPIVVANRTSTAGTAPKVHCWASSVGVGDFTVSCATGDGTTSAATVVGTWIAIDTGG